MVLRANFESQPHTGSLVFTTIISAPKTRSESSNFVENHQKVKNPSVFTQKAPKSLVSGHSKWIDDIFLLLSPTTTIPAFEVCSTTAYFMKIHQKLEKSPIFTKMTLESLISGRFSTDFLPTPPIAPTKHPCNPSSLLVMLFIFVFNHHFAVFLLDFQVF